MDSMFWIFVGVFALAILTSLALMLAIVYFGINAVHRGDAYFTYPEDEDNGKVSPLLGVVHPKKKG